jgi:hypothetical protein
MGTLVIAYALCERCLGRGRDTVRRLDARMRQRYGVEDA